MAQHDMNIANADGSSARADINNALLALVSNNSGATEPATKFSYMWWPDTTAGYWKQRNAANTAWLNKFKLSEGELALIAGSATQTFSAAAATAADHVVRADQIQRQSLKAFTTSGTSTAYTLAPAPAITANAAGIEFDIVFHAAPGTTPTLAVSGLAALGLRYMDGASTLVAATSEQVPINWRSKVVCVDSGGTLYWMVREVAFLAATTADMEAGTSVVRYVVPGRQHKHPSASKFFLKCGVTGNILASNSVSSITDDGAGALTVTLAEAFSSANYAITTGVLHSVAADVRTIKISSQLAGSFSALCVNGAGTAVDPEGYFFAGFGDT